MMMAVVSGSIQKIAVPLYLSWQRYFVLMYNSSIIIINIMEVMCSLVVY